MDAQIIKQDRSFTFESYGVTVQDFIVSSIPLLSNYSSVDGSDGTIDYGATYGTRTITVPFHVKANDLHDFVKRRDELFALVCDKKSFYIQERRRRELLNYGFIDTNEIPKMKPGTENESVNGKRYKVRIQNTFELSQALEYGEGELVFETTELPFAETVPMSHKFNGKAFRLVNEGLEIHPFEQDLKITIKNLVSPTGYVELENKTNGSRFRLTDTLNASSTIVLDGANITLNGLQALRKTNKQIIELEQGWNDFVLRGASSADVIFEFPYYYH